MRTLSLSTNLKVIHEYQKNPLNAGKGLVQKPSFFKKEKKKKENKRKENKVILETTETRLKLCINIKQQGVIRVENLIIFIFFCLFKATPMAYGGSQARG